MDETRRSSSSLTHLAKVVSLVLFLDRVNDQRAVGYDALPALLLGREHQVLKQSKTNRIFIAASNSTCYAIYHTLTRMYIEVSHSNLTPTGLASSWSTYLAIFLGPENGGRWTTGGVAPERHAPADAYHLVTWRDDK